MRQEREIRVQAAAEIGQARLEANPKCLVEADQ
jgi:hypothetical protein